MNNIILNDNLNGNAINYVGDLFKPLWSSYIAAGYGGSSETFGIYATKGKYVGSNGLNGSIFNDNAGISTMFVVSEVFIEFIENLNVFVQDEDKTSEVAYEYTFSYSTYNLYELDSSTLSGRSQQILDIIRGDVSYDMFYGFNYTNGRPRSGDSASNHVYDVNILELLLHLLYSTDARRRNLALTAINEVYRIDTTGVFASYTPIINYDANLMIKSNISNTLTFEYPEPLKLETRVENPDDETMYLYFPTITSSIQSGFRPSPGLDFVFEHSGDNRLHSNSVKYYKALPGEEISFDTEEYYDTIRRDSAANKNTASPVLHKKVQDNEGNTIKQIPFAAVSIGKVGSGSDIEYDFINIIDYLDSVKFTVEVPNVY